MKRDFISHLIQHPEILNGLLDELSQQLSERYPDKTFALSMEDEEATAVLRSAAYQWIVQKALEIEMGMKPER